MTCKGKRKISILLLVGMILSLLIPFTLLSSVKSVSAEEINYSDWQVKGNVIESYLGAETEVIVPSEIDGVKITTIGSEAFINRKDITSITIEEGIRVIDVWVFGYCENLKEVILPESLEMIGSASFYGCKALETLVIPSNLYQLGTHVFRGCESLTNLTLSPKLKVIPFRTFSGCKALKTLILPENLEKINSEAFYQAGIESLIIPNEVKEIGDSAFYECKDLQKVEMQDEVKILGSSAFYNCSSLKEITLSNKITEISDKLFFNCSNLSVVKIPKEAEIIGESAFENCTGLENVEFSGDKLKEIKSRGFYLNQSLLEIKLPSEITDIGESAFYGCEKINRIALPSLVTLIKEKTFYDCHELMQVVLPKGLLKIEDNAFGNCYRLNEINNPSSLDIVSGQEANGGIGLYAKYIDTGEDFKSKIKVLDNGLAFLDIETPLLINYLGNEKDISLPNNFNEKIFKIAPYAFYDKEIDNISFPKEITEIGENAFEECHVKTVNYKGSYEKWKSINFNEGNTLLKIAVIHFEEGNGDISRVDKKSFLEKLEGVFTTLIDILIERIFVVNFILILFWGILLVYGCKEKNKKRNKTIFIIIACIQWILISGLRSDSVGDDTVNYLNMFDEMSKLSWKGTFLSIWKYFTTGSTGIFGYEDIEPLFILFNRVFAVFSTDHTVYKFVIAIIFMTAFGKYLHKYSEDPCLSFILYGSLFYNMFSLTGYRQVLAVALVLFGFRFIKERKLIPFLIILLCAFLLHRTSAIFILLYIFADKKFTSTYLLFVVMAIVFMFVLKRQVFEFMRDVAGYEEYVGNYGFKQQTFTLMFAGITIIAIWRYNKICEIEPKARQYYNGLILAWTMMPLVLESPSCLRLVYNFAFVLPLVVPLIVKSFGNRKERMLIYLAIYGILVVQVILSSGTYEFFWM